MKATCIITSIFAPTPAVASFAVAPEFGEVLVIGDRKSPPTYAQEGARFISLQEQLEMPWHVARVLPLDHYSRKMIGYLEAASAGADILFDTDDDNRLIQGRSGAIWEVDCQSEITSGGKAPRYVNVYRHFTQQFIWPRGLPLECVLDLDANNVQASVARKPMQVGVWQGLADGDPDVDAIYRLTNNQACIFEEAPAVALAPGVVCPFNSQNTAFVRDLLPLMYLPAQVSFRYTDILRGLVAQPILWATGRRLCFTSSTVFQDRNAHNYLKDFESETSMYLTGRRALDTAVQVVDAVRSVPENLHAVYSALERIGIVPASEMKILEAWLADCTLALSTGGTS